MEDWERQTPLTQACVDGDVDRVRDLLDAGADIEAGGRFGETPLMWAAIEGREAVVSLLIERGAQLDTVVNSKTAIMAAAQAGQLGTVRLLAEAGARLDVEVGAGLTAVTLAWAGTRVRGGQTEVIEYLLDRGAPLGSGFDGTPEELRKWVREWKEKYS